MYVQRRRFWACWQQSLWCYPIKNPCCPYPAEYLAGYITRNIQLPGRISSLISSLSCGSKRISEAAIRRLLHVAAAHNSHSLAWAHLLAVAPGVPLLLGTNRDEATTLIKIDPSLTTAGMAGFIEGYVPGARRRSSHGLPSLRWRPRRRRSHIWSR